MIDVSDDFWVFVGYSMANNGCTDSLRETLFYTKVKTSLEHGQKLVMSYVSILELPEDIIAYMPAPDGVVFAPGGVFFDDVDSLFRGVRDILAHWEDPRCQIVHECLEMLVQAIELENCMRGLEL